MIALFLGIVTAGMVGWRTVPLLAASVVAIYQWNVAKNSRKGWLHKA
ncbi:hypothetical protein RMSM_07455 [Rhodopirellula maiorica SM1]|uniref:Uncharacterized protein n=1 Tax=Rhodopirellula maiorica SM1 TaxID=1265738 RepID=M5RNS4_9BACT|nr:hypothetical protein RMSM_07455 [Rhodopirellula maiorica SM1]